MKICRLGGGGKKVYPAIFSAFFNYDFCRSLKSGEGQLPPHHTTACYLINLEEKIQAEKQKSIAESRTQIWSPEQICPSNKETLQHFGGIAANEFPNLGSKVLFSKSIAT